MKCKLNSADPDVRRAGPYWVVQVVLHELGFSKLHTATDKLLIMLIMVVVDKKYP